MHAIIWRLLLILVLFKFVALCSAAAGKALSLQFHEEHHFARMNHALVQEHVMQVLSQLHRNRSMIVSVDGHAVKLQGMACAHWSALCYLGNIIRGDCLPMAYGPDDEGTAAVKHRYESFVLWPLMWRLVHFACCAVRYTSARHVLCRPNINAVTATALFLCCTLEPRVAVQGLHARQPFG